MSKIALLADSCCDLNEEDIKKFNIRLLPVRIVYKDQEYLDKLDIKPTEIYERMPEEIPSTSLPDVEYTRQVLRSVVEEGYTEAVIITIATVLSGTQNAIRLVTEEFPELKCHFFDTKALGYPEGAVAMRASDLLNQGLGAEQVIAKLEAIRQQTYGYITPDTLDYLEKGGRIGYASAKIGKLLSLKPIITMGSNGELTCCAKVRGRKNALEKFKQYILDHAKKTPCRVWVLDGYAKEETEEIKKALEKETNIKELYIRDIGAAMGVHCGPGCIGVCIQEIN